MPNFKTLAVYIHWPFCRSKCPYCDFNSHVREQVDEAAWREALLRELAHFAAITPEHQVVSIFFGGGTPSLMPPATAAALIDAVAQHWPTDPEIEITLEANPTSVEAARFAAFRKAGVNRVSLGVQAMNDDDLRFLGREHSAKEALQAVETAAAHFPRHNFDLIYARPGQTVAAWESELRAALPYTNGHLSLYQLTIEPGTAFYHRHQKGEFRLPDEDTQIAMYELTQDICEAHGLPAYEISNHATPGQESQHNLCYWRGDSYVGIGPGAHGRISLTNGERIATATTKSPERWLEQVNKQGHAIETYTTLNTCEQYEERILMGLRLHEGMDMRLFDGKDTQLATLQKQGLIHITSRRLTPTRQGQLLLNRVTEALLS